jgi:hypothetical protein
MACVHSLWGEPDDVGHEEHLNRRGSSQHKSHIPSSNSDQTTYTVIDRTLVLKGTKGEFAVDIQLQGDQFVAGGKTSLRSR